MSTRVKGMQFDCKLTMQHHVNRVVTGVFIIATSSETTHEKKILHGGSLKQLVSALVLRRLAYTTFAMLCWLVFADRASIAPFQ